MARAGGFKLVTVLCTVTPARNYAVELYAKRGVQRAAHADIRYVSRAFRQYPRVSRRHMPIWFVLWSGPKRIRPKSLILTLLYKG